MVGVPEERIGGIAADLGSTVRSGVLGLTQREAEVLRRLANGTTTKDIAKTLHISYETVKEHVQHILGKIGVNDRTQAALWAVRKELV